MYYVGIDISKYKHDCFITDEHGEVFFEGTIQNNQEGFGNLLSVLNELDKDQEIRIGLEATGHYGMNLKLFLENAHHSFSQFNPALIRGFIRGRSLRKTKTDKIDAKSIAKYLMSVEYKPYSTEFYHMYSLKSLTRLRDSFVRTRSIYMVKITNVLDHIFPEFKAIFKDSLSKTALHILKKYPTVAAISKMRETSYDELRRVSRGKFTTGKFFDLKDKAKNTIGVSTSTFELELTMLIDLYEDISRKIDAVEAEIIPVIQKINPPTLSIKGIGPLTSAIIIAEFGDISRFSGPAAMLAFAGLEPAVSQSGKSEHFGKMVKRGSSHLRYALLNVCMPVVKFNYVFAQYYNKKIAAGKPHRVAQTHVCRKLIRVIYTLETKNISFDQSKLR